MEIRAARGLAGLVLATACSSGTVTTATSPTTQTFSRDVDATPAMVVTSTVKVFGDHHIPIAVADQPSGTVRSAPVNLREVLIGPPDERVTCTSAAAADTVGAVMVVLEVKAKGSGNESVVDLNAQRDNQTRACVVHSSVAAALLDEIVAGAEGS